MGLKGGEGDRQQVKKNESGLSKERCSEDLNVRTETGEQFENHQLIVVN